MAEFIAVITLFGSIIGMGIILHRKIPALLDLPEIQGGLSLKTKIFNVRHRVKDWRYSKLPPLDILLQKILSRIRILSLRAEKKTSLWLQRLREKSAKKKEDDKYWRDLKESINKEKAENNKNNSPS